MSDRKTTVTKFFQMWICDLCGFMFGVEPGAPPNYCPGGCGKITTHNPFNPEATTVATTVKR